MSIKEQVLKPVKKVWGGAQLDHKKYTAEAQTVVMPPPDTVKIPMQQHIGAPCIPCVKKGDTVFVGTLVGDSEGYVSAPIYSSVSGTVEKIDKVTLASGASVDAVVIKSDGNMTPDESIKPQMVESYDELIAAARRSGLVGLGGAGFPAFIKLTKQKDKPLDTLIINAAECEPYITADYRECIENTKNVLQGIYMLKNLMGFENVIIAVEENKPKAIELFSEMASETFDPENHVQVMKLKSSYPQGAEKMIIYTTTGRVLRFGKLPADAGCVVMNVTSVSTLNTYIRTGMPLTKKRLTVSGGAVKEPKNVIVPLGVTYEQVIDFAGGLKEEAYEVLSGGPMMGIAVASLDIPVVKQNNALLFLTEKEAGHNAETNCINCGRCASVCPMGLRPGASYRMLKKGNFEGLKKNYTSYCIECGCCSYVCPARLHLTQSMKTAKAEIKKR